MTIYTAIFYASLTLAALCIYGLVFVAFERIESGIPHFGEPDAWGSAVIAAVLAGVAFLVLRGVLA